MNVIELREWSDKVGEMVSLIGFVPPYWRESLGEILDGAIPAPDGPPGQAVKEAKSALYGILHAAEMGRIGPKEIGELVWAVHRAARAIEPHKQGRRNPCP